MNKNRKIKNNTTIITLIISIISLIFLSTIAYSSFSSTMNITGIAHARVEANVRITDFALDETSNATSLYEEFGKEHISSSISFKENGYAIYKIEVTNYGETNVGISKITGLPENISYELIDYNLKDKICNINGKCNNFATKIFYIKFTGSNTDCEFTLNFEFKLFHNFTYENFNNTYTSGITDGDSITIDLSKDSPKVIQVIADNYIDYTYENNLLILNNVTCDLNIKAINDVEHNFTYTGDYQTFTAPYDGMYKVELWGAQGGGNYGGPGGYTSGTISMKQGNKYYIYIGEHKDQGIIGEAFNGGGESKSESGHSSNQNRYSSGGGATDIRLISGEWNDFNGLKSRIMVAAGGGGNYYYASSNYVTGGPGGGLIGIDGLVGVESETDPLTKSTGGTQISGGTGGKGSFYNGSNGGFGYGGPGNKSYLAGGGSGYYGGGSSGVTQKIPGSGAGGSSFISGHNGCDAIAESSTEDNIIHTGQPNHYNGYKFTDTKIIDGDGYNWTTTKGSYTGMPTYDSTSTMSGNKGNGYAKITLLNTQIEYDITYSNIVGSYQTSAIAGSTAVIKFTNDIPDKVKVLINNQETNNYVYENGTLTISNITGDVHIKGIYIYDFNYTGAQQEFTVPHTGLYKVELWGAKGGSKFGGLGAYTSGLINLQKNTNLYIHVGEHKKERIIGETYNGGGVSQAEGGYNGVENRYGPGGGATDIRLVGGAWDNFDSLKSRIMVAAGGGGSYYYDDVQYSQGGAAGGLVGDAGNIEDVKDDPYTLTKSTGGTQTSGGLGGIGMAYTGYNGGFGYGGPGTIQFLAGGGSGYYGGGSSGVNEQTAGSGAGGSSFISGHNGCDAIEESSTKENIIHTNQPIHYSGYQFTDTVMIDGAGYNWTTEKGTEVVGMPTHDGTSTMTGNTGNGYAKITLLEVN